MLVLAKICLGQVVSICFVSYCVISAYIDNSKLTSKETSIVTV